ncbi:MAG: chaperone modulator CbpM [Ramlibacter sp.]
MQSEIHDQVEVLAGAAFTADDIARACGTQVTWVQERVQAGVLRVDQATGEWRFDGATLVRARRIARLEMTFEADPQLAALAADLMEEVEMLRRRLRAVEAGGRA